MPHPQIVTASDLSEYANTRESQHVVPELVYHLVDQANPTLCRIPHGTAVNQPGWDGKVEITTRYRSYIPAGTSYWEITTSRHPKNEATCNFRKRSKALSQEDRADAVFVFVTPRTALAGRWSEPEQSRWIAQAQSEYAWGDIRILDATQLAAWLQGFPALGRWLATFTHRLPAASSILPPSEYWEKHVPPADGVGGHISLPPGLFLAGREDASDALTRLLSSQTQTLLLLAESEYDVDDFVAAYLQNLPEEKRHHYTHHCLLVRDPDAWQSLSELPTRHVLVGSPRLGLDSDNQTLQTLATNKGHAIVIPICGRWPAGDTNIIRLRSPSQAIVEETLRATGLSQIRSRELAHESGGQLAALRRSLLGLGSRPPYATWSNANRLGEAGLVGRWNAANLEDRSAIEAIVDRRYSEWVSSLRRTTLRTETPIVQHNERWRFVARGEAWSALGCYVSDDDLNRFRDVAISLLSESDPKYELPRDKRYAAAIYEKLPKYSDQIRAGVAESVALLGSRSRFLSMCSQHKPENTARHIVHEVLSDAKWTRWASLGSHLPLIAEGAPEQFLAAVESDLSRRPESQLETLLIEDSHDSGFLNTYETAGLLWALETLAWSPDYLSRVGVILATMASMDPGSRWVNGPENTLRTIFLPWCPQTSATDDQKAGAIRAIMREQEGVGWKLLVNLLPQGRGFSTGCRQPTWRPWVLTDWTGEVRRNVYWRTVDDYFDLAVESAGTQPPRLRALAEHLPDLPSSLRTRFVSRLASNDIRSLSERDRFVVWEELDALLRRHRRFSDAHWALPEAELAPIRLAADGLSVQSPVLRARWLFAQSTVAATDGSGSFADQMERLEQQRRASLRDVLDRGGVSDTLALSRDVAAPHSLGNALAFVIADAEDAELIGRYRTGFSEAENAMLSAYVWRRFDLRGWEWVDTLGLDAWSCEQCAGFLALLPFRECVWTRVSNYLGDAPEHQYWMRVDQNPYGIADSMSVPIEKFMECKRFGAAIACLNSTTMDDRFDSELAGRVLVVTLETQDVADRIDGAATVEIIVRLQKCSPFNQDVLCRIEWGYLDLLGIGSSGSPITLRKALASDPEFFISVLELVFGKRIQSTTGALGTVKREDSRARNAFRLLESWDHYPGADTQGEVDSPTLRGWIEEARQAAERKDLLEVADRYIGKVLVHALRPNSDNWVPDEVAELMNEEPLRQCRSGFSSSLISQRGAFAMTGGREEAKLARDFRVKANRLDVKGYARLAATVREVADYYLAQGEQFAAEEAAGE